VKINRTVIKNILANIVAFLLLITVFSGVYYLFFRDVNFIWWLLIFPFLLMQFFRAKITDVKIFILLHVIVNAYIFFSFHVLLWVGYSATSWFIITFMIVSVVYSFIIRSVGERSLDMGIGVFAMVVHVLFFVLVGLANENPDIIMQQLIGTSLMALSLVIVHIHMDNIDTSLNLINYIDNRTHRADKIIGMNNTLIIAFTVLIFGVGVAITAFPLGRIIAGTVRRVFGDLLMIFQREPPGGMTADSARHSLNEGGDYAYYTPVEEMPVEDAPINNYEWWATFVNRIFIVVFLLLAVGLIFAIYMFIKNFNRRRKKKKDKDADGDENIALTRNIMDDLRDLLPRFGRYSKNAIRRAYAKKVNMHIRSGVPVTRSDTTDIIADKIRARENIDELTTMYEKVRYFND